MTDRETGKVEHPEHDIVWHARRWFAAGAITFCVFLLLLLGVLFAFGPVGVESWVNEWSFFVKPAVWLLVLPFVYKGLR